MIFLIRGVVWAVELVNMVLVGGGTKKARGGAKCMEIFIFWPVRSMRGSRKRAKRLELIRVEGSK